MKLPGVCLAHAYSFVTKSSLCLLYFYRKSNFVFRNLITRRQISCIFTNYFRLRWRTTEASQEEESGVHGVGFDLTSSFLKILIYIFLRDSLVNVCVFIVFFFFFLYYSCMRCSPPWKQMKDILREATVENITILFCPLIAVEGACDCVWVCEWVFVRIHQGVIWNYFWQWRSILIANTFWYWKKEKKITLFHWGSSAPLPRLPPIPQYGLIN